MAERGIHIISNLRKRYLAYQLLANILLAAAITLAAGALFYLLAFSLVWLGVVFLLVLAILSSVRRPWAIRYENIAAYLDKELPELQESTSLILLPPSELNILQGLARAKAEDALSSLNIGYNHFAGVLVKPAIALLICTFFYIGTVKFYTKVGQKPAIITHDGKPLPPENILPQIEGVKLIITPPAYTGKPKRTQDKFNFSVEEGAAVIWHISTNVRIRNAYLLFNNKERVSLKSKDGREWSAQKLINTSGFYQVSINGKLSDLYQVQAIKDAAPVVHVKTPKQYTYIDAGEPQQVNINASLTDDYGVAGAQIIATVAKGRGEGVKFKEYKLAFNSNFSSHLPQYTAQKLVQLKPLNMEPGDELYFYVKAQDTRNQETRTDVFTVVLQDTAELLSMDGIVTGASLKPEFFRSERQIIIDAEKLIKDKDTISAEKFNARSNDLGIDQKLLRLRYGKFLGEEDEVVEGPKGNDNLSAPEDFSNGAKILKEYTDDHDKAEDAQFFEPAVKAQLKATLTEMWKAELQLRLYKPQAALPFAYKALRLLKDLQQKSRSFVAKTSYNPPPLKPEKRLSGELDKVLQPMNKEAVKPPADRLLALKNAIAVLEQLKQHTAITASQKGLLQAGYQQLATVASGSPGAYLPGLNAVRRLLSAKRADILDVNEAEQAIQRTLTPVKAAPVPVEQMDDMGLSRSYYKQLKSKMQ
ncbi:hypothetical protein DYU05_14295 [Mucilaginibacter terrenus]|uniref:DUF4175 family protein n=1 Tax=Mucilaginibacter terrenus TaxID=2482727 RepID=A0A3E2NQT4_9SPHI|nr:DUF4175 family protein [Mucilaginibacter terrenus]RFZ83301.1 hypothetical protein DYU05_14295 [Mucilaginibacter terrenus]